MCNHNGARILRFARIPARGSRASLLASWFSSLTFAVLQRGGLSRKYVFMRKRLTFRGVVSALYFSRAHEERKDFGTNYQSLKRLPALLERAGCRRDKPCL